MRGLRAAKVRARDERERERERGRERERERKQNFGNKRKPETDRYTLHRQIHRQTESQMKTDRDVIESL